MEYMKFSPPPHGLKHLEKWQPVVTSSRSTGMGAASSNIDQQCSGNIGMSPLDSFNGKEAVLKALP
jgi:hypothetical protein